MMKKLLSIAITILLLASCSHEMEVSPSIDGSDAQQMTFELETEELMDTRSVDGIAHIDQLCYAIWDHTHGEMLIGPATMDNVDFSSGKLSIKVMLLGDDEYTAYFWAQSSQCGAYHFFNEDSKTISVDYEQIRINDPKYDAFFGKATFKGNDRKKKVSMARPFALVSLMTPLQDWEALEAQGKKVKQSAVAIKGIGTTWNVDTDEISNPVEEVKFSWADIPAGNVSIGTEDYKLLSQCYVLAPLSQPTKHEVTFQLKNEEDEIIRKGPVKDIPVKRNNRTNIIYHLNAEEVEYSLFYPNIQEALGGINDGKFEGNAMTDGQGAKVAIYVENNVPHIVLLENTTIDQKLTVTKDVNIELNGCTLTSTDETVIEVSEGRLHIEGQNGSVRIANDQNVTITGIMVKAGAALTATDCTVEADCKIGFAYGIHSSGDVTLTRCKVIGKANHTANADRNNYATTSRAVLAEAGSLVVNDCYVYGMHSGMTVKCDLTVNGGTYDGYSHGGIYFAAQDKVARIYNAKLNDAELLDGYEDDGHAGTNKAGMYIGEATGMKVFMDNCEIYGRIWSIVLKDNATSSNNTLYISNSKINNTIRNSHNNVGINHIYLGKGNDFGPDNLKEERNYTETQDVYNENYQID